MRQKKAVPAILMVTLFFLAGWCHSFGQSLGIRAGRYMDTKEYFIGGELISRISGNLYFNPNAEYVFVENITYMTVNFDFHYDFYTSSSLFIWLGAGLGILYVNPDGPSKSDTDVGANLLFGVGINTISSLTPYFQVKYILVDKNELVLGIGLRF